MYYRMALTHKLLHTHTLLHTLHLTLEALGLELYRLLLLDGASCCRARLTVFMRVVIVVVWAVPIPIDRPEPGRGEVRAHHANMARFHAIPVPATHVRARNGLHGLHRLPTLAARDGQADRVRSFLPGKGNQPAEGGWGGA